MVNGAGIRERAIGSIRGRFTLQFYGLHRNGANLEGFGANLPQMFAGNQVARAIDRCGVKE
jgi:hypothetical protein